MAGDLHGGAAAPGPVTPGSDDAPGLAGLGGVKEQGNESSRDGATVDAQRKHLDTLKARAALLGLELILLDDGAVLLRLAGVAAVDQILPHLGAAEGRISAAERAHAEVRAMVARLAARGGAR